MILLLTQACPKCVKSVYQYTAVENKIMFYPTQSGNQDIVDAASHQKIKDFVEFWWSKHTPDRLPTRSDFDFYEITEWVSHVIIMDVLSNGSDFRYRLIGTRIVEAVGRDLTGKNVSNSSYTGNKDNVFQTFSMPVTEKRPIIRRGKMIWLHEKKWKNYESVHCPLFDKNRSVNMTIGVQYYS